jgi:Ca2+-binding RTX toxin-like protein
MYMAIITMALIAVPRSIYRALVWIVMGIVGWFVATVERAYADVTYDWMNGSLVVSGDDDNDCIRVSAQNDSVLVWDLINNPTNPSVVTADASEVMDLDVYAGAGNDFVTIEGVTDADGFTSSFVPLVEGGEGNDTLLGSTAKDNCLEGQNGNDSLVAYGGADILAGGDGEDNLRAGSGDDNLYHNTTSSGTAPDGEPDTLDGGPGSDLGDSNAGEGDAETSIEL